MPEKLILVIDKNEYRYGWEDHSTENCILNIGNDEGIDKVTTLGQVTRRLNELCKDGFIKKKDVKKYRLCIGKLDHDMGTKIHLNQIVKLAEALNIQVNVHEYDKFGHLEDVEEITKN